MYRFLPPLLFILACSSDSAPSSDGSTSGTGTSADGTPSSSSTSSATTETGSDETATPISSTSMGDTSSSTSFDDDGTTTSASQSCVDHDLGMATGTGLLGSRTSRSGDDYDLVGCAIKAEGSGFVVDPPAGTEDFVIAWTFPETGGYVVESSSPGVTLGIAPADCDAEILSCDEQCGVGGSALLIEGRAGQTVHLIVESVVDPGAFTLSIELGSTPNCADDGGGGSSTGA